MRYVASLQSKRRIRPIPSLLLRESMLQATVEFSAKTSRGPHVAMFALGKLAVERSETCGLRSLHTTKTPHPSAFGCHLLPLEKAWDRVDATFALQTCYVAQAKLNPPLQILFFNSALAGGRTPPLQFYLLILHSALLTLHFFSTSAFASPYSSFNPQFSIIFYHFSISIHVSH